MTHLRQIMLEELERRNPAQSSIRPDKAMRMPLSKQRNKHIQRTLVEAAKLAPRQSHELAVIYDREKQKGNGNRATLAIARKMVAYLLAVDRQQRDFVPAEERLTAERMDVRQ